MVSVVSLLSKCLSAAVMMVGMVQTAPFHWRKIAKMEKTTIKVKRYPLNVKNVKLNQFFQLKHRWLD